MLGRQAVFLCSIGIFWLFATCTIIRPTSSLTADQKTRINQFVDHVRKCYHGNVLGLSVVDKNNTNTAVYENAWGERDIKTGEKANTQTRFCIASCSKAFTSTLIAILIVKHPEKRITFDTYVKSILGKEFQLHSAYMTNQVTIRDLLAHKTGVSRHDMIWIGKEMKNKNDIYMWLKRLKTGFPFRYKFLYNNLMYELAGKVAEKIDGTGKSWEQLIRQYIFEPLGMNNATFVHEELPHMEKNMAKPVVYLDIKDKIWEHVKPPVKANQSKFVEVDPESLSGIQFAPAAGAICVSAEDMSKWILWHADWSKNKSLLQQLAQTYTPQVLIPGRTAQSMWLPTFPVHAGLTKYGLGWVRGSYRGRSMMAHNEISGNLLAYHSLTSLLKNGDQIIGIHTTIGGSQKVSSTNSLIHMYIQDVLLGVKPWLTKESGCTYPSPWVNKVTATPAVVHKRIMTKPELQKYTGVFENEEYGKIYIAAENGFLMAKYGEIVEIKLIPTKKTGLFFSVLTGKLWYLAQMPVTQAQILINTVQYQGDGVNGAINKLYVYPIEPGFPNNCLFYREGTRPRQQNDPNSSGRPNELNGPAYFLTYLITIFIVRH